MQTKEKDRAWMKAEAEEHGCMEPQRFCDSFDCTTVHHLIADVDDAVAMLELQRDHWRGFIRGNQHAPTGEVTLESARITEATLTNFLKEPKS